MTVTPIQSPGNSSKFRVITKNSDFTIAISYTLRTKVWELANADVELSVAQDLAEAIVSRHSPALPFKSFYIFAEHNSEPTAAKAIQHIRKYGFDA